MTEQKPHDSWAEHYEHVMALTYGEVYERLTASALQEVSRHLSAGASVIDFGAGCGRLAIPLVADGYRVTAVEPSSGMIECLTTRCNRLTATSPGAATRLAVVQSDMQESGLDTNPDMMNHDMALCVFTVVAYLLDRTSLDAAFRTARASLGSGGVFLVDVPHPDLFQDLEYESANIIREVSITQIDGPLFDYRESTRLRTDAGHVDYADRFSIRLWSQDDVRSALAGAGFLCVEDVTDRFADLGASYLLATSPGE